MALSFLVVRVKHIFLYETKYIFNLKEKSMMKTIKNKLVALSLILVGLAPTILDRDSTALIFFSIIAIPLFFAKENWIY